MSIPKRETVLRFRLTDTSVGAVSGRFFPDGQQILNRTEWRGKEPRSCAVTGFHWSNHGAKNGQPMPVELEVTYRPKGVVTYVAETRYDGWTAMALDKSGDGTLLDGHGSPLPAGAQPVYLPYEVYPDVDFNELDFGEFLGESEPKAVGHLEYDDFMRQTQNWLRVSADIQSALLVPRKQRPVAKIVVTNLPLRRFMPSDTRFLLVRKDSQNFGLMLLDNLVELISGFFEGRYSLKTISNEEVMFVELSSAIIELTEGKVNGTIDTLFEVFSEYVSAAMLEDLAKRLLSVYEVELTIVEGKECGFLIRRPGAVSP